MPTHLIGGRLVAGGGLPAGRITIRQLIPKSLDVELVLNGPESIDADILLPLTDPMTGVTVNLPEELIPGRDFLGVVVDGVLMGAGPLWGDPWATATRTASLHAKGLWSYFDRRAVLPPLDGRFPREVTSKWWGLSLRTIAKRLVQQTISHPAAGLPIDFEPDFPGDHEREYPGSDMMSVGEALENLTDVIGGPDIAFRPYITPDLRHVRWRLVTGELTQAGDPHYFDLAAPTPYATSPGLDRDGRELASRLFLSGTTVRNLHPNGSFEETTEGAWAGAGASALASVRMASPVAVLGTKALRFTATAAAAQIGLGWDGAGGSRAARAEPGKHYVASAYVCSQVGRSTVLRIAFRDGDGTQLSPVTSTPALVTTSAGWSRFVATAQAPAVAEYVFAVIATTGNTAGQFHFVDGVMLHEGTEPAPPAEEEVELQAITENTLLTDAGYPLLESWESRPSVLRTSTLQAYADEGVMRGSAHVTNRPIVALRDQRPKLGSYLPGDYARVHHGKSPREPEGTSTERIIRVSFKATGPVQIDTAPQRTTGYPVPASDRAWLGDQLRRIAGRVAEAERKK